MTTDVVIDRSSTRGSLGLCLEFLPSGIVWYTFLICVERVFSYQTIPFLQRLCLWLKLYLLPCFTQLFTMNPNPAFRARHISFWFSNSSIMRSKSTLCISSFTRDLMLTTFPFLTHVRRHHCLSRRCTTFRSGFSSLSAAHKPSK